MTESCRGPSTPTFPVARAIGTGIASSPLHRSYFGPKLEARRRASLTIHFASKQYLRHSISNIRGRMHLPVFRMP
jgi:hypothetical protein